MTPRDVACPHRHAMRGHTAAAGWPPLAGEPSRHHCPNGGTMYRKPRLERFGTFRELTLSGTQNYYDILGIQNNDADSCDPTTTCWKPVEPTHS